MMLKKDLELEYKKVVAEFIEYKSVAERLDDELEKESDKLRRHECAIENAQLTIRAILERCYPDRGDIHFSSEEERADYFSGLPPISDEEKTLKYLRDVLVVQEPEENKIKQYRW